MENEYYGVASTPMDDYLAHYGVKGMRWGVRKAIASGNVRRLGRQYAKAQKKLVKLEKRAANSSKYAKRAAKLGAGAAVAGGLAAVGTEGISRVMKNNAKYAGAASKAVGRGMVRAGQLASRIPGANKAAGKVIGAGYSLQANSIKNANAVYNAGRAVNAWGKSTSMSNAARKGIDAVRGNRLGSSSVGAALKAKGALKGVSNNTLARIGAGAVGAGLAAGAAKNAYRAKTAQKKAAQFRSEMNKAFAGTKYASGGSSSSSTRSSSNSTSSRKRRRR